MTEIKKARESAVKSFFQEHNRMALVVLQQRPC